MSVLEEMFSLDGRVAVVSGATGVIGRALTAELARAGATVVVLSRNIERARAAIDGLGSPGLAVEADVLDEPSLDAARDRVLGSLGRVDILLNIAGGNLPGATLSPGAGAFELAPDALRAVVDLNLMGTVLPIKAFGPLMVAGEALAGGASIVNVASVSAMRPLSRVPGYSAAKAAVASFTQWLAVELGRQYRGRIRVNALVPGFFVATQNRSLLTEDDGAPTPRGHRVLEGTPLGRFGAPGELAGAAVWLCGPSAAFVTGSMIVVDGGFSAASGV